MNIVNCNILHKYPRTKHLQGSRKYGDDFELESLPFEKLIGYNIVLEEKLDGSNCAISFSDDGKLLLQSRGRFLTGQLRERQFDILKAWSAMFSNDLNAILGKRYIMYGENMCVKHTIFYDQLPHYFFEFDIYDKENKLFLSTKARNKLCEGLNYVSVPVLYYGDAKSLEHIKSFIVPSLYKTNRWRYSLKEVAIQAGLDPMLVIAQTDETNYSEGIYIKIETEEETIGRSKFVRSSFCNKIIESDSHWMNRPIIMNQLANGIDIFK